MSQSITKIFHQLFSRHDKHADALSETPSDDLATPETIGIHTLPLPDTTPTMSEEPLEEWSGQDEATAQATETHSSIISEAVPTATTTHNRPELQQALKDIITQIPECEAIAYVDIDKEQLLAFEATLPFPETVRQLIAAATADLFTAPNVIKISSIFKQRKGLGMESSNFDEIIIHGDGDIYVFVRTRTHLHHIVVFSCNNHTTSGAVVAQARELMPTIEALHIQ